ncbi:MAG: hypothetical protein GWM87_00615 [Xanthomonadales bacterium]|nr:hypothetical protein [Xanthomonadales bacterium]NIX11606.1 hypothetical protein [Xanthomonadales bacterium]
MRQVRRDIAAEAARIMATEGQRNFGAAKRKAAERIGVSSRVALPSNLEVEAELRAYQGFYGGEAHERHLETLRATAIEVMRSLEPFSPRLVGPVLDGTADRHSRVSLHLFSDPPEAVAMHLRERGLNYRQEDRRIRWHDGSYRDVPLLVMDAGECVIEMALFGRVDLRQAPPSPVDGRPQKRASLTEVECLVADA